MRFHFEEGLVVAVGLVAAAGLVAAVSVVDAVAEVVGLEWQIKRISY